KDKGVQAEVINARFLKPLDTKTIKNSIIKTKNVVTIEDGTCINGLGTAIKELIIDEKLQDIEFKEFAYPDEYIKHGSIPELEKIYNMDIDSIVENIYRMLKHK
ncbi:MAG: 1-deoxy-D-xylulose-5-phosphate synthase, partial [Clostridia bacterium]|nr:1-deoxy-D-xylulose-5-phosphate synthase [Clostridia bacterium]